MARCCELSDRFICSACLIACLVEAALLTGLASLCELTDPTEWFNLRDKSNSSSVNYLILCLAGSVFRYRVSCCSYWATCFLWRSLFLV